MGSARDVNRHWALTPHFAITCLKRGFYEKVTDVNISSLFFLRWGFCFSFRLRRMLFSTVFLYALCMSIKLCVGWGPMEKSMLPVFGRSR